MEKQQILDIVGEELAKSTRNNFAKLERPEDHIWTDFIGGFAAGDDPLFAFFKEDIGDFFWSPAEAFRKKYPDATVTDSDVTVLSLGFRVDELTRQIQREQKTIPSFRWLYARNSWEPIIEEITDGVVARLKEQGITAVVVDTAPGFGWQKSEKYGLCSNWSHRHAAYVAGLGTFGLCDGLITSIGKALRWTTLILDKKYPADPRPYTGIHDYCLYYKDGSCRACINACPVHAISGEGHDKAPCEAYVGEIKKSYRHSGPFNAEGPCGCGLCQGNVPCQNGIPAACLKK